MILKVVGGTDVEPQMRMCQFTFDGEERFIGYTDGTLWNGFDNIWTTPEQHADILRHFHAVDDDDSLQEFLGMPRRHHRQLGDCFSYAYGYATQVVRFVMPLHEALLWSPEAEAGCVLLFTEDDCGELDEVVGKLPPDYSWSDLRSVLDRLDPMVDPVDRLVVA